MISSALKADVKSRLEGDEFVLKCSNADLACQISREIVKARIESRLTQRKLASLSGSTQTVISRLETGKARPSLGLLLRLARSFGKRLEIKFD